MRVHIWHGIGHFQRLIFGEHLTTSWHRFSQLGIGSFGGGLYPVTIINNRAFNDVITFINSDHSIAGVPNDVLVARIRSHLSVSTGSAYSSGADPHMF